MAGSSSKSLGDSKRRMTRQFWTGDRYLGSYRKTVFEEIGARVIFNFQGGELSGVVREVVDGFHPSRIEGTCPTIGSERRNADKNSGDSVRAVNCELVWWSRLFQLH